MDKKPFIKDISQQRRLHTEMHILMGVMCGGLYNGVNLDNVIRPALNEGGVIHGFTGNIFQLGRLLFAAD